MIESQTPQFFFYNLIKKAQKYTSTNIPNDCECYVVFLLSDLASGKLLYSDEPTFDLLKRASESEHPKNFKIYKLLGDSALVTLSFFPEKLKRKNISEEYVQTMGRIGYSNAGSIAANKFDVDLGDVYETLANTFDDVTTTIKKAKGLAPFNVVR